MVKSNDTVLTIDMNVIIVCVEGALTDKNDNPV